MRKLLPFCGLVLLTGTLISCRPASEPVSPPVEDVIESSSSSVNDATDDVSYEGVVQKAGISIYMEGTHRLYTDDGSMVLLESDEIDLDQYLDLRVKVTGDERPTVEQGAVFLQVHTIADADSSVPVPEVLPEGTYGDSSDSSPSSESSSSSVPLLEPVADSSSSALSSVATSSSSSVRPSSSSSPRPVSSSSSSASAASSSAAAITGDTDPKVAAMAKSTVNAVNFTQQYCSRHVGFCAPLHRNWYFNSFGATTSSLWHVEFSSEEIQDLGDGPLLINLLSGELASGDEMTVKEQGAFVVGYRSWTNGRHFEISAPKELRDAVRYIIENIIVYESVEATSGSSSAQSSSASSL